MTPEIKTRHLALRPVQRGDAAAAAEILNDLDVARNLARVKPPYTLANANAWIDGVLADAGKKTLSLAIDRGGFIGVVTIANWRDKPMLSYWLGKSQWGKGYMSEAVDAAIKVFFETSPVDFLLSAYFEDNIASMKIQRRLGFKQDGTEMLFCLAREKDETNIKTKLTRRDYELHSS